MLMGESLAATAPPVALITLSSAINPNHAALAARRVVVLKAKLDFPRTFSNLADAGAENKAGLLHTHYHPITTLPESGNAVVIDR